MEQPELYFVAPSTNKLAFKSVKQYKYLYIYI